MQDLRDKYEKPKKKRRKIRPLNWIKKNKKYFFWFGIIFIIINLIFNPSGVASFISKWLTDFTTHWEF